MSKVKDVRIDSIITNADQPRKYFDEEAIEDLAVSIKENGLVQPITVRKDSQGYKLIAGERRLRACMSLNYKTIPAYIISSTEDESMYMSLIENIQREDLSSIEEAKAYLQIISLNHMTQQQLAEKIGKSQSNIANKIRLLNLDGNVKNAVESKLITERHARALLGLDPVRQNEILKKILNDNLTVAQVEKLVKPKRFKPTKNNNVRGYSRNVQVGVNTIKKAIEMVSRSGLGIDFDESENDEAVRINITINK